MWFLIILVGIIILAILSAVKQSKKFKELGAPVGSMPFDYEGGHPLFSNGGKAVVWASGNGIKVARVGAFGSDPKLIAIPSSDIVTLSLDNNIQHVNTGGGRSIGGAIVGGAIAGPIGAVVGSRSSTKVKKVDESKTYLFVRHNGIQFQMIFKGGTATYNRLAQVFAGVQAS